MPRSEAARTGHPDRIAVAGGGVIGLTIAYWLREAGHEVIVLERDRIGSGASRGNAGEVCPAISLPLPSAHALRTALRTLNRRDSALFVRPQASLGLARFLMGFAWNARPAQFTAGARALGELSRDAVSLYRDLRSAGIDVGLSERPYLYVYPTSEAAQTARHTMQHLVGDRVEIADSVINGDELAELEPCLAPGLAAVQINGQLTVDPSALVDGLATRLREAGVEIREGARVTGIDARTTGVTVRTTTGSVDADTAVIAAGIWSVPIARSLGVRLPIVPGKGYSFSVPMDQAPHHPIALEEAHVVLTPMGATTRIAGTMELDLAHDRFDPQRIEAIVAAGNRSLRGVNWSARTNEWVGPRSMTPTGLPLIGRLGSSSRVIVAAGHNMLGVTLAPATGRAVAAVVRGDGAGLDLRPFAVRSAQ